MKMVETQRWRLLVLRTVNARLLRRTASVLLVLFIALWVVVPPLPATEGEGQEPPTTDAAQKGEDEDTGDEETAKKKKKGPSFIAIPIIITEPAVGYGLGAAFAHFHKKKGGTDTGETSHAPALTADTAAKPGKEQKVPPTISGIAAAYTENGTWGVGIAHTASWKKDRMRYTGAVGYAHVVSSFYFNNEPVEFKLDTGLFYQAVTKIFDIAAIELRKRNWTGFRRLPGKHL